MKKHSTLQLRSAMILCLACAPVCAGQSLIFDEHLIKNGYSYAYGVAAADLDLDGDVDLTSTNVIGSTQTSDLYWFENNGQGGFQQHIAYTGEVGWLERHALGDLDGDGRPDAVVAENRDGKVVWYVNQPNPGGSQWQRRLITASAPRAYDIALADFNGDNKLDVAVAGYNSNIVTWYPNPGSSGWNQPWTQYQVGSNLSENRTIRAGDFNGDGRMDLLATAAGASGVPVPAPPSTHNSQVVWYENIGQNAVWTRHVIDIDSRAPIQGNPYDIDLDGDLDVAMAFGLRSELLPLNLHEVAWYENLNHGITWSKHVVGSLPAAFEATASDLDLDGDVDMVASAWAYGDRVVWFENSGDPRGSWTQHVIKAPWYAANQVVVADLNGDGWPDIVATADDGSSRVVGARELRWWENLSAGDPNASRWVVSTSGDWNNNGNWVNGVPNASGKSAYFLSSITSPQTIFANTSVTVGSLRFDNPNGYQIAGQGSLHMDVVSGNGTIEVLQGSHKINIPLFLHDNTIADVSAGATLKISNPLTLVGGSALMKVGLGTLTIEAPVYSAAAASLVVAGGELNAAVDLGREMAIGMSAGRVNLRATQHVSSISVSGGELVMEATDVVSTKSLSLSGNGKMDLQGGKLVMDYTGDSPLAALQDALNAGRLRSSLANADGVIGLGEASDLFGALPGSFAGEGVDSTTLLAAYTVIGDASLDGTVNSADFNLLASNYGRLAGSRWTLGDFDNDGRVSTLDFNLLAGHFGQSVPGGAALGAMIPEPALTFLLPFAASSIFVRRRR